MNRTTSKQSGFTIIELTLAMAFVSVLLIVIALTVIQIINIYNKGMTLKAVDQSGRAISTDIRRTLSESQPFTVDNAHFCLKDVSTSGCNTPPTNAKGGRLCTGAYSYIWNYAFNRGGPIGDKDVPNTYSSSSSRIRFVRVRDVSAKYCASPASLVDTNDHPVELLSGDANSGIALQDLTITKVADDSSVGETLYLFKMVIGTDESEAVDTTTTTATAQCKSPSGGGGLQNFCAINRFDFTALAGNKGGSL